MDREMEKMLRAQGVGGADFVDFVNKNGGVEPGSILHGFKTLFPEVFKAFKETSVVEWSKGGYGEWAVCGDYTLRVFDGEGGSGPSWSVSVGYRNVRFGGTDPGSGMDKAKEECLKAALADANKRGRGRALEYALKQQIKG